MIFLASFILVLDFLFLSLFSFLLLGKHFVHCMAT
jgi:hypothetical protein